MESAILIIYSDRKLYDVKIKGYQERPATMKKTTKLSIAGMIAGFLLLVTGFFLRTVLFPVQDMDMMTEAELLTLQKEAALNYPVGTVLYYTGAAFLLSCIVFTAISSTVLRSRQ